MTARRLPGPLPPRSAAWPVASLARHAPMALTLLLGCRSPLNDTATAVPGGPDASTAAATTSAPVVPDGPDASTAPAGSSPTPTPALPTTDQDELGVRWQLGASHQTLTMAQREAFILTVRATNEGSQAVDPQHMGCVEGSNPCLSSGWRVNGQQSFSLNLSFGNGVREKRWSALPPGETVSDSRKMGERLFEAPGSYSIEYQHGRAVATVRVEVKP